MSPSAPARTYSKARYFLFSRSFQLSAPDTIIYLCSDILTYDVYRHNFIKSDFNRKPISIDYGITFYSVNKFELTTTILIGQWSRRNKRMAVNTLALYLFVNYNRSVYNCQCSGFLAAIKMSSSGCTYLAGYVIRQRLYVVKFLTVFVT